MRKPESVEIVAIAVPVLAEMVAVVMFIAMIAVFAALRCGA